MKVTLIDHMGSDLSIVNAARVSFAKVSKEFTERDAKLIRYLAKHNHWTPFGHASLTLHIKAPIFIARQLGKHQTGLVWNEVSRRYVDDEPEVYIPDVWRSRPDGSIKQGSGGSINLAGVTTAYPALNLESAANGVMLDAVAVYEEMIEAGVAPEQARMVLPQSMYTEWYWTGSLAAFARVYKLRAEASAQVEVQEIARMLNGVIKPLYPVAWEALVK